MKIADVFILILNDVYGDVDQEDVITAYSSNVELLKARDRLARKYRYPMNGYSLSAYFSIHEMKIGGI